MRARQPNRKICDPMAERGAYRILVALGLAVLLAAGCRRPKPTGRRASGQSQRLLEDQVFSRGKKVPVLSIRCRQRLVFPHGEISGLEPPGSRNQRLKWVERSVIHSRIYLHRKRLVWELPAQFSPGGARSWHRAACST